MRRGRRERDPLLIGIAGLAALVAVAFFSFTKRVPFTQEFRVDAVFQTSNQLRQGSPVRIAGVDIGKVIGIRGKGTMAIVTMEITENGRPLHRDATMKIRPRLFLEGGYVVDVQPGSPSAPVLRDGGTIPLGQTAIPVQFHPILSEFDRPARRSLQGILKELSTGFGNGGAEAFGRTMPPLAPTLRDAAIISEAARGIEEHDLSQLVGSLSRVTVTLARHDLELADLVTHLNRTSRALASHERDLSASVREIAGLTRETPRALTAVDEVLPSVRRTTGDLRPTLRRLPGDLDQVSDVLDQGRELVKPEELPAVIQVLEPALRDLPGLVDNLRRAVGLALPVSECLRTRAIPVLKSHIPDGDLSSGQPVWLELAHLMVGFTSMAQNFDGNGSHLRLAFSGVNATTTASPTLGELINLTPSPILGANPLWFGPGTEPPIRSDKPCIEQRLPDLSARTGLPLPSTRRPARGERARLSRSQLEGLVRDLRKGRLPLVEARAR